MKKKEYIEMWEKRFIELNSRKPTRLERMSFRVGFNAGETFMEMELEAQK